MNYLCGYFVTRRPGDFWNIFLTKLCSKKNFIWKVFHSLHIRMQFWRTVKTWMQLYRQGRGNFPQENYVSALIEDASCYPHNLTLKLSPNFYWGFVRKSKFSVFWGFIFTSNETLKTKDFYHFRSRLPTHLQIKHWKID